MYSQNPLSRFPWAELKYLLWLPLYLLLFIVLEHLPMDGYWATQLPVDNLIPFCEWFVIPYCLWYPLLIGVGTCLLFLDKPAFRRYMLFLAGTFFISALIWLLIPNGQDLRPAVFPRDNVLTHLVARLYSIDTNTNVFPSAHVVGSIGAALGIYDCRRLRNNRMLRRSIAVLAVLICLSTVFIKQHAIVDGFAGVALALLAAIAVYRDSPILCKKHK